MLTRPCDCLLSGCRDLPCQAPSLQTQAATAVFGALSTTDWVDRLRCMGRAQLLMGGPFDSAEHHKGAGVAVRMQATSCPALWGRRRRGSEASPADTPLPTLGALPELPSPADCGSGSRSRRRTLALSWTFFRSTRVDGEACLGFCCTQEGEPDEGEIVMCRILIH